MGWQPQAGRILAWQHMQERLDALRVGLDELDGSAEVLLATHYHEFLVRRNPLRARPPRPGPPRSERIPAVWLSALYGERGVAVRDTIAFPARDAESVHFERVGARPALLFSAEQPFFVNAPLQHSPHEGGVAVWLDGLPEANGRDRFLYLSRMAAKYGNHCIRWNE